MTASPCLLSVSDLTLRLRASGQSVVDKVGFKVAAGEIIGVVGESGSGKTLTGRAIVGLIPPPIERTSGSIQFENEEITTMSLKRLRQVRGARIGVVFQEPMTSLNPSMRIGEQLAEALILHRKYDARQRRILIDDMLRRVGLRDPESALKSYPYEFSGGMRQRIMLASVMLLKPALLIADEPTTALDAVVQREVLELIVELTQENGTAVIMISHDLGMIARYTDRAIVMRQGEIVEQGQTTDLLARPQHAYTRKLLAAMPHRGPARSFRDNETPVLSVRNLTVAYRGHQRLFRREAPRRVLHGVSFDIAPGQVVAVVGSSGSGKTTLGRAIASLVKPSGGEICFEGKPIDKHEAGYWGYRLNCQMVFQDPFSSLDPRMTIASLVGESLRVVVGMGRAERAARVKQTLLEVGLDESYESRFPHELSGGQRQRVAIARALARRPKFVIADEPVSALDVTIRAQVLELFADLQKRYNFSCLFISHDLGVVEQVADRIVVMNDGYIVEQGPRDAIFDAPVHPYTRKLLSAIPALEATESGVRLTWRFENADQDVSVRDRA